MGENKKLLPRADDLGPYIRAGLQLIPLRKWDSVDTKGRPRGKTPRDGAWQAKQYDSLEVQAIVKKVGINAGVRLPAGIMVLDVDPRNFGGTDDPENLAQVDRLAELVKDTGLDLSSSPHTITGSGGHHYWFKKPEDVTLMDSLQDYPGIEFKSLGRQVVAAGSVHPGGQKVVDPAKANHYRWNDLSPPLEDMPDLPGTLLNLIRRPTRVHGDTFGGGELTPEMLAETLEQIDPADYAEQSIWQDIMMASHHATHGEGRQEFIDWSTGDSEYADHGWLIGRRWDSLHMETSRGGRPVTVKFLHKLIQEAGYEVARTPPEDDFDEWEERENPGAGVDDELLCQPPTLEGKDAVIEEMNANHCVVFDGGKFRIFTEEFDPVLKRRFYQRSTKDDFQNFYCNSFVEQGNDRPTTRAQFWLRSAKRRQYKGVIFDPSRDHDRWLNLWKGWSVQAKSASWSLLRELIRDVLTDGDAEAFEYVLNWIAHLVQRPAEVAEVAIAFRGAKGTGKGTLGRALADLAGAHGLPISSPEHLVGRFNSHLQNCVLLFADEAFWAGDKAGESKLKQLVTEPTITYEGKGRDAVVGKNLIHIIIASNSEWVVPAGMDGERRFAAFDVNEHRRGDKDFFSNLRRQLYDDGGLAGLLYDMQRRDIAGWHPRDNIPQNRALAQQKLQGMQKDALWFWWHRALESGELPYQIEGCWREGPVEVTPNGKEAMISAINDRGREIRGMSNYTKTRVAQFLREAGVNVVHRDRQGRGCWLLPELGQARAAFAQMLGDDLSWED
ncbi:MAG: bifunctional DNA primase/polymerase [Pseudomonadales bacterium]|nr:bifunctional DNA primase/polymerase [Pseudomonadales bacterium]MDN5428323.1 bifunctional DNA primase/polymerase [Pseudomonadales bacterium]